MSQQNKYWNKPFTRRDLKLIPNIRNITNKGDDSDGNLKVPKCEIVRVAYDAESDITMSQKQTRTFQQRIIKSERNRESTSKSSTKKQIHAGNLKKE